MTVNVTQWQFVNLCFNISSQCEHSALNYTSKHECLAVRKNERQNVQPKCKYQRAVQRLEVDTGLSVALCKTIEQNVCRMTQYSGAKNHQCNADNGKKHDQYHEVLLARHQTD